MTDKKTKITQMIGGDFLDIGEVLREVQESDPQQFVKVSEGLGIGLRKAYYLVSIAKALAPFELDRDQLRRIGWTKLHVIGKALTAKNHKILLAQAEVHPVHELRDILAGKHAGTAKHCVVLYLFDDEYELFREVLKAFGATDAGKGLQFKESALVEALKAVSAKADAP